MYEHSDIDFLKGAIITKIEGMEEDSAEVYFYLEDGSCYKMYHEQDCCESVWLSDVCGDVDDLLLSEIHHAEERTTTGEDDWGTNTHTFYDIQTAKGCVNLRWVGESNGYYSESVYIVKVK